MDKHNNYKKWGILLLGLVLFYQEASAELFRGNYHNQPPEERCLDIQAGITSYVEMAERERCGNHLPVWQAWFNKASAQAKYQWCLKQDPSTLEQVVDQLYADFFGAKPLYTQQAFLAENLCRDSIRYYSIVGRESRPPSLPWITKSKKPPPKAKPFQPLPSDLARFIREAEAQGSFRRNNPARRLYPERKGCQFKGAPAQLSPDRSKKYWLLTPSYACWDIVAVSHQEQYWSERFWIVEELEKGGFRVLLEDDGDHMTIGKTQTSGYYDLSLTTDSGATLAAGDRLDPYSKAIYQKILWDNDVAGNYSVYQRFHYNPASQQYESPDKGLLFSPTKW